MRLVLLLAGNDPKLASDEAKFLLALKKPSLFGNVLFGETGNLELSKRLAYTHSVYTVLFSSSASSLLAKLKKISWNNQVKGSFAVRIKSGSKKPKFTEKQLASIIWTRLRKPVVNLERPDSQIEFLILGRKVHCCVLLNNIKHDFESRKANLRPGFSPVSLHPRLAAASINLTGIRNGTVLDPFCGTGGILIEAGFMGLRGNGQDISKQMLKMAEMNLRFYKIKNYSLKVADATKIKSKFDYLVSDLPYGKNSKVSKPLLELYAKFLKILKKNLRRKAVVIFPSFVDSKRLCKDAKLKINSSYDYFIHKSLSKKILVISSK